VQEPGENESMWIDMPPEFLLHGNGGQIGCYSSIRLFIGCFFPTNSMSFLWIHISMETDMQHD
jgi:hypothetical protein